MGVPSGGEYGIPRTRCSAFSLPDNVQVIDDAIGSWPERINVTEGLRRSRPASSTCSDARRRMWPA
jgi:hypothetical protein